VRGGEDREESRRVTECDEDKWRGDAAARTDDGRAGDGQQRGHDDDEEFGHGSRLSEAGVGRLLGGRRVYRSTGISTRYDTAEISRSTRRADGVALLAAGFWRTRWCRTRAVRLIFADHGDEVRLESRQPVTMLAPAGDAVEGSTTTQASPRTQNREHLGRLGGTTQLIDRGPSSARFDVVILGDGYRSGESAQSRRFADRAPPATAGRYHHR